ncbi:uncharacterized protein LOC144865792 [Branchiostoma floridae x Branchiostoma japonicum]
MSGQQEFICGLSRVVTIAVLPRLNVEELMFELNRRIQNLDKENSIKDRLVCILRDMMLEEYRQLVWRSEMTIPEQEQETVTMHENIPTTYTETMSSETSSSDPCTSLQSSGLEIVNSKKNNNASNEALTHTKELVLNAVQVQLKTTLPPSDTSLKTMLPLSDTSLIQMNATADSCIEEEDDVAMTTEDEAGKAFHDELNMDTPTFNMQALDTINLMGDSCSEKSFVGDNPCEETAFASRKPTPDQGDVHINMELYAPEDDQISRPSSLNQIEDCTYNRDTGLLTATLPQSNTTLIQVNNSDDSGIKKEDITMANDGGAGEATFSTQVLDTVTSASTSHSEKPAEGDKLCEEPALASCGLTGDHGDIHIKKENHESESDHIGQTFQPPTLDLDELCTNLAGRINSRDEESEEMNIAEAPLDSCKPTQDQDSENKALCNRKSGIVCKRYLCDFCGYTTSYKQNFSRHRQRHIPEKPFMCAECGYRASNKRRLIDHMRKHTGEKPFKCNQCHYQASYKTLLVQHMKTHSDQEPYSCELCEYKTFHRSHINRHMKYHAGVKPYKCEQCDYSAVDKNSLTKHSRRHTGEGPYSCQECDYKAIQKGNLVQHMRSKHHEQK